MIVRNELFRHNSIQNRFPLLQLPLVRSIAIRAAERGRNAWRSENPTDDGARARKPPRRSSRIRRACRRGRRSRVGTGSSCLHASSVFLLRPARVRNSGISFGADESSTKIRSQRVRFRSLRAGGVIFSRGLRRAVHTARIAESPRRSSAPASRTSCSMATCVHFLATKDHVNVFLYDGAIVPDPDGIITGRAHQSDHAAPSRGRGFTGENKALTKMFKQIVANNRAGGWRKLKRAVRSRSRCWRRAPGWAKGDARENEHDEGREYAPSSSDQGKPQHHPGAQGRAESHGPRRAAPVRSAPGTCRLTAALPPLRAPRFPA